MCGCGGSMKKKAVPQAPAENPLPTINYGTAQMLIKQQKTEQSQQQHMQKQMIPRIKKPVFR
jgi:hypothetical protein